MLRRSGVTIIELLVVLLIISLLATIATGIYTDEKARAEMVAAKDLIRQLEVAITRYNVDVGSLPPSGSGDLFPPPPLTEENVVEGTRRGGSAYLYNALVHSMSGSASNPASRLWDGPYINIQPSQLAGLSEDGMVEPGQIDILDPWGNIIFYVKSDHYAITSNTFPGGVWLFQSEAPEGANPDLPAPNPYVAYNETYYNTGTYQLYSFGPDGDSFDLISTEFFVKNHQGTEQDDINNFGY